MTAAIRQLSLALFDGIEDVATRQRAIALDAEYMRLSDSISHQLWKLGMVCREQRDLLRPLGLYHQWLEERGIPKSSAAEAVAVVSSGGERLEPLLDNFVRSALSKIFASRSTEEQREFALLAAGQGETVRLRDADAIRTAPNEVLRDLLLRARRGDVPDRGLLKELDRQVQTCLFNKAVRLYEPWGTFRHLTPADTAICAGGSLGRYHYGFFGVEVAIPFRSIEDAIAMHPRYCTPATRKADMPLTREEIEGYYRSICESVEWKPLDNCPDCLAVERTSEPAFKATYWKLTDAWQDWKARCSRLEPLSGSKRLEPLSAYAPSSIVESNCVIQAESETVHTCAMDNALSESFATAPPIKNKRVKNDYYPTPDGIVKALLDVVSVEGLVLEPCAGHGAIAQYFPGCKTNDPFPAEGFCPDYELDATDPMFWEAIDLDGGVDWVVTNPPYGGLVSPITIAALTHARKGVAMLLRLNWLEPCDGRAHFLKAHASEMSDLIVFNPRPQFRADVAGTDNVTVAWFVWQKGWQSGCRMHFCTDWKD